MAGRFEVFRDVNGGYRWRLVGGNGEIMAQSEVYATPTTARRGAKAARRVALLAKVVG